MDAAPPAPPVAAPLAPAPPLAPLAPPGSQAPDEAPCPPLPPRPLVGGLLCFPPPRLWVDLTDAPATWIPVLRRLRPIRAPARGPR
eukprot:8767599-Alexandrium_andersonii.AAC.1